MKQASIVLRLEKHGHDVQKQGVTPAEVAILVAQHHKAAGGDPIKSTEDEKELTRTDEQEVLRLKQRYGTRKVVAMFPGGKPNLPASFKEAVAMGLSTTITGNKLLVKA